MAPREDGFPAVQITVTPKAFGGHSLGVEFRGTRGTPVLQSRHRLTADDMISEVPQTQSTAAVQHRPFQFTGRLRSFRNAVGGILRMLRCQHNAWIHLAATLVVIGAGAIFRLSGREWCWI